MFRRIVGSLLSAGGLFSVAIALFGLPGHIDDAAKWLEWAGMLDSLGLPFVSYSALVTSTMVFGLALLTYDWWMPRVKSWRGIEDEATDDILVTRFRGLAPLVQRQMADCRPLIEDVEGYEPDIGKYRADYLVLIGELEALGVEYPLVLRNDPVWYQYLANLNTLVETGQLAKARRDYRGLLPPEGAMND